jgi:3-oxoacyl-[acyl-carrier protein] reductase
MKTFLLTGVSSGVGIHILKFLLNSGYTVYGISRTTTDDLTHLTSVHGSRFTHLQYDLSQSDSIKQISTYILVNKIKFDSFINNAATAYDDIITNANIDKLVHMYTVNTIIPIMLTKLIIRNFLLYKTKGTIVHISSISAHTGYKGLSMYASTKGAIEAFSKNIAREWGELGIRSNCIVAGFMDTAMSETLTDEQKSRIYNRTALKQGTDIGCIVDTTNFLTSDISNSITGQNIFVDSGTI